MEFIEARYQGHLHIESYGNGGFRFGGVSHTGSLLFLPRGVEPWEVSSFNGLDTASFAPLFEEADKVDIFLLGCGDSQHFPGPQITAMFKDKGVILEAMNTGAACRTYNVLLGENRAVAAGLIAVR